MLIGKKGLNRMFNLLIFQRKFSSCNHLQVKQRGFTLLELMIVVAVMGILASIALPSYQEYVKKGRRAAAQSHMMDVAQRQQQYFLDTRSYAADLSSLSLTTPSDVSNYDRITIEATDAAPPTFKVTATPSGAQSSDPVLTLDNTGAKTPSDKW
jgi:type IV pilus assembly protein PilE